MVLGVAGMGKSMSSERRKYPRIPVEDLISLAPLEQSQLLAVSKDVSLSGIRFEAVGCEIGVGEVLRITFNVDEHTVDGVGRVVWATELDAFTLDVGMEFIEIGPLAQRLLQTMTKDTEVF